MVKNLSASVGDIRDMGSISGSGRFPGGGHGNPLLLWIRKIPWRWAWQPTPLFFASENQGYCGVLGASRDSTGYGAMEEGLISIHFPRLPLPFVWITPTAS